VDCSHLKNANWGAKVNMGFRKFHHPMALTQIREFRLLKRVDENLKIFLSSEMATMTMELDVSTETEQDILSTDNQPTPEVLSKYRLAGHFCSVAIKAVLAKSGPGVNCSELCHFGDETILSQVASSPE